MTSRTAGGGKPYADIALVARLDPDTEKLMASTADGDPLPASVIERLAGESSWFGLVLSAKGVPMWKGRNTRKGHRVAVPGADGALWRLRRLRRDRREQSARPPHGPLRMRRRHRFGQPHTAVLGLSRQDPRPLTGKWSTPATANTPSDPPTASTAARRCCPTPLPYSAHPSKSSTVRPMLLRCSSRPSSAADAAPRADVQVRRIREKASAGAEWWLKARWREQGRADGAASRPSRTAQGP